MYKLFTKARLSKNLSRIKGFVGILIFCVLAYFVYRWFTKKDEISDFKLEHSPLHVERIESIAEIATISYSDEVVVDTIEYYKNTEDLLTGSISKLLDPKDFKYGLTPNNIKRRLSLIVKGELRVGFDFKNSPMKVIENDSSIQLILPKANVLDILVNPSDTEIFQENGKWNDFEVAFLQKRAKQKLLHNMLQLDLIKRAEENMELLVRKQLYAKSEKKLIVFFRK